MRTLVFKSKKHYLDYLSHKLNHDSLKDMDDNIKIIITGKKRRK